MYSNHKYGSKEKLFEMMYRVNLLNEEFLSTKDKNKVIAHFINYCDKFLNLGGKVPKITVTYEVGLAKKNKSFGGYDTINGNIAVVGTNRNLADVLRSLAHELVHHKQKLEGRIKNDSGETGSEIENEANSTAGIIMRDYGKLNPNIFE